MTHETRLSQKARSGLRKWKETEAEEALQGEGLQSNALQRDPLQPLLRATPDMVGLEKPHFVGASSKPGALALGGYCGV